MAEPILFLPGLLCDSVLWRAQIEGLADRATSSVADLTRDDSVGTMAERALAAMPERFAVCGLSMGGYVALAIMAAAPHRVTRLCLMDTSARADTEAQARRRRALMASSARNRFRGVTRHLLPMLLHPDRRDDAALGRAVMDMAERVGREAFLRQETAILNRPDRRGMLGGIAVPTLVLVGSHDEVTPPALAREIADAIPDARLVTVGGAAHLPPLEQPECVTISLRDWIGAPARCRSIGAPAR
jgi:pimeloyl-ACP methyl ester carboxylesterase